MKFKVGDKVRVREDLENDKIYGNYEFIKAMAYLKGEIITIKEILKSGYRIEEDYYTWTDEMLEEVEKEVQEKTFREVIADIKEGEVWESHCKKIIGFKDGDFEIRDNDGHKFGNAVSIRSANKYRLKRKEYTFEEAFKAYEKGKEIESCYSGDKYMIQHGGSDCYADGSKTGTIGFNEIRGKWYINN